MNPATYVLALLFLAAGFSLGWYANRAYAAHGDVKSTKAKIPGFRKNRYKNGVVTAVLAFGIAVVILGILQPHH